MGCPEHCYELLEKAQAVTDVGDIKGGLPFPSLPIALSCLPLIHVLWEVSLLVCGCGSLRGLACNLR
jgi:hypothetical protein